MNVAVAYNQSDLYQRFRERVTSTAPPLLRAIEYFDYDACEKDVEAIEAFISQCLRRLEMLTTIALALAKDDDPVEDDLIEWLFNLSKIIDGKILASQQFEKIAPDKRKTLESVAADLAYATSILDLNNCREIKDMLACKGYVDNG